jgi:membrane protein implicated in regulation of membrane protease activity
MVSSLIGILQPVSVHTATWQLVAAQVGPEDIPVWIWPALLWGLLALFLLGIIIALVLWIQGSRIRKKAEEAGVKAPLPDGHRSLRPFGIREEVWGCIGLVFLAAIALTAPFIMTLFPQTVIAVAMLTILVAVVWFFLFYGIVYIVREYTRRQRLLEEAIRDKGDKAEGTAGEE